LRAKEEPKAEAPSLNQPTRQPLPESSKPLSLAQPSSITDSLNKPKEKKEPVQSAKPNVKSSIPQPEPDEMLVVYPGNKENRAKLDLRTKWLHDEMNTKQVDKVKHECEQIFGYEFMQKMFCGDFKKHGQVIASLNGLIKTQPEHLLMSIDVVFKWAQCKMAESSNTTFASQLFDFYTELLVFMPEIKYTLWDHEAMILIPWMCIQAGGNNKMIIDKVKSVIKLCFHVYDHK
jgi:hypothetical protein